MSPSEVYIAKKTGAVNTSTVYHLNTECPSLHQSEPFKVTEETAQAFGRTLCSLCSYQQDKSTVLDEVAEIIAAIKNLNLPDSYEIRIHHYSTKQPANILGKKQATNRIVWRWRKGVES